jgi:uncharacterized protein (TIGR00299 family) protein
MTGPPRRVLWIDATAGIAGDMLLGALVDAGADRRRVHEAVVAVAPEVRLTWHEVTRAGFRALHARVSTDQPSPERDHALIRDLVRAARLPDPVTDSILRVFTELVSAEARVHGLAPEAVHVHEVGAWDSIADVVGSCAALHDLGLAEIVVSPIATGSGRIRVGHGDLPVPPPVVTELLRGWRAGAGGGETELATPTGVALATTLASAQGPLPEGRITAVGVGAGTRNTPGRANAVRAVLVEVEAAEEEPAAPPTEDLVEMSCTVDDLDPRSWPAVLDRLLADGALDAWLVPVVMKKGRPGHVLHVLARPADVAGLGDVILRHTTTLGYRSTLVSRTALPRAWVDVPLDGGAVPVKIAHLDGRIVRAMPEYEECAALASRLAVPVHEVLDAAGHAAAAAGLVPGAALPAVARSGRDAQT